MYSSEVRLNNNHNVSNNNQRIPRANGAAEQQVQTSSHNLFVSKQRFAGSMPSIGPQKITTAPTTSFGGATVVRQESKSPPSHMIKKSASQLYPSFSKYNYNNPPPPTLQQLNPQAHGSHPNLVKPRTQRPYQSNDNHITQQPKIPVTAHHPFYNSQQQYIGRGHSTNNLDRVAEGNVVTTTNDSHYNPTQPGMLSTQANLRLSRESIQHIQPQKSAYSNQESSYAVSSSGDIRPQQIHIAHSHINQPIALPVSNQMVVRSTHLVQNSDRFQPRLPGYKEGLRGEWNLLNLNIIYDLSDCTVQYVVAKEKYQLLKCRN